MTQRADANGIVLAGYYVDRTFGRQYQVLRAAIGTEGNLAGEEGYVLRCTSEALRGDSFWPTRHFAALRQSPRRWLARRRQQAGALAHRGEKKG